MKVRLRPLGYSTLLFWFVAIGNAWTSNGDPEDKFVVLRAAPSTVEQLQVVRELHDNMHKYDLDFWLTPVAVGHKADIMVRENQRQWLENVLTNYSIPHSVTIRDVQHPSTAHDDPHPPRLRERAQCERGVHSVEPKVVVLQTRTSELKTPHVLRLLLPHVCAQLMRRPQLVRSRLENYQIGLKRIKVSGSLHLALARVHNNKYGLGEYHSYDHIVSWMEDIQRLYHDRAKVVNIGITEEGRYIKGIKIGSGVHRTDKRVVWIDGGIHAREWAAVHTVVFIIDRLIADYETDPLVHRAVDQLNFYIFPVLNPDGYEFSRSEVSPTVRLWRKNRSSMICKKDQWFRERCCGGVDLNRNFDWFWGGDGHFVSIRTPHGPIRLRGKIGSSSDRCSEIYHGKGPFSEAEARAVRDMVLSPELRGKVDAFLTLHTYSQMWIHPFSHQRKTVPEDITDIEQVGRKAIGALESVYGTKYRFGTGADILYPSSGGSDDWAKGKGGAKYVYLMELRPNEDVWDGFILDSRQLIPTGRETWAGIKVVIEAVLRLKRDLSSSLTTSTDALRVDASSPIIVDTSQASSTMTTAMATTTAVPVMTTESTAVTSWARSGLRTSAVPVATTTTAAPPPPTTTTMTTTMTMTTTTTTAMTTASTILIPTTSTLFYRRRVRPVRPIFVTAEARSLALKRLRQQQAHLMQMRQRARSEAHSRQSGNTRFSSTTTSGVSFPSRVNVPSIRACADRSPWCVAWQERNPRVCIVSSIFMRRDCARTCRFC